MSNHQIGLQLPIRPAPYKRCDWCGRNTGKLDCEPMDKIEDQTLWKFTCAGCGCATYSRTEGKCDVRNREDAAPAGGASPMGATRVPVGEAAGIADGESGVGDVAGQDVPVLRGRSSPANSPRRG